LKVSPHDANTITFSAVRHKLDDYAPYIYRSTDSGATWTRVVTGIASDHFACGLCVKTPCARACCCRHRNQLVCVVQRWRQLECSNINLPICPIYDLIIKNDDLVCGTHGRAMWILDDITPLRQYNPALTTQGAPFVCPAYHRARLGGVV
jgi:hypothetical protein